MSQSDSLAEKLTDLIFEEVPRLQKGARTEDTVEVAFALADVLGCCLSHVLVKEGEQAFNDAIQSCIDHARKSGHKTAGLAGQILRTTQTLQ